MLGKLATHEFATGGPSYDLPWPPANNPWLLDRFPGGSSSGAGAAVAAGLAPGAMGSVDNTAAVSVPAGVTDPDPANDMASDSDPVPVELMGFTVE